MPLEATQTAMVIQNSLLTDIFIVTGQAFWGVICLIGIITVLLKVKAGFFPKKK